MLAKLRKKAKELYNESIGTDNEEKYRLIVEILKDETCFKKMEVNEATSILLDLGLPMEEALKTYIKLTIR